MNIDAKRLRLYAVTDRAWAADTDELLRQVADTCNIIKTGPRELSRDEIYDILLECL